MRKEQRKEKETRSYLITQPGSVSKYRQRERATAPASAPEALRRGLAEAFSEGGSEPRDRPAFAPQALRRGLAVALRAKAEACRGVRGAKPLG
jgi:hypothetical protein